MFKIISFMLFLGAQIILSRHDLVFTNWEWWVLILCFIFGNILWEADRDA